MSDDKPTEKPPSTSLSPISDEASSLRAEVREALTEVHEALTLVRQSLFAGQGMQENYEKLQARTAWLTKLEAAKAEHVLALSLSVERDSVSRDRQTAALTLLTQKITEGKEDAEYTRAGIDAIVKRLDVEDAVGKAVAKTRQVMMAQSTLETETRTAIVTAVREATGSQRIVVEREEVEGKIGALARGYTVFTKAPMVTQVMTFFLMVLAAAVFFGWLFYKLHKGAEAPQGAPVEKALGHRPQDQRQPPGQ